MRRSQWRIGRRQINQYTRYLTVLLALFQSYGIGVGLQTSGTIVQNPGPFFLLSTVITLTGGTLFLMWLGEQITSRGIGNGTSLIIFAASSRNCPPRSPARSNSAARARSRPGLILGVLLMCVAVVAFIVFMERAQRRLLINYPKRQRQQGLRGADLVPAARSTPPASSRRFSPPRCS